MARSIGEFEHLLLFAVLRLDDQAYGGSIRHVIHDRTGRTVSPGAIYTALDRLERRGFVGSKLGDPTPERGGKRKRFYHLRPAGAAALREAQTAIAQMARGLKPRLEES
jgi:PadR family transcriptional regulator, regulatory protein PadR